MGSKKVIFNKADNSRPRVRKTPHSALGTKCYIFRLVLTNDHCVHFLYKVLDIATQPPQSEIVVFERVLFLVVSFLLYVLHRITSYINTTLCEYKT